MNEVLSDEINRLEKAFERFECDTPFLKSAVNAFKEVMISRIILKARLSPDRPDIHIPQLVSRLKNKLTKFYDAINSFSTYIQRVT